MYRIQKIQSHTILQRCIVFSNITEVIDAIYVQLVLFLIGLAVLLLYHVNFVAPLNNFQFCCGCLAMCNVLLCIVVVMFWFNHIESQYHSTLYTVVQMQSEIRKCTVIKPIVQQTQAIGEKGSKAMMCRLHASRTGSPGGNSFYTKLRRCQLSRKGHLKS